MSFHTWLCSTPKYHLTSYAMGEISGHAHHKNFDHGCPTDTSLHHTAGFTLSGPIFLLQMEYQPPINPPVMESSKVEAVPVRHDHPTMTASYQVITPPIDHAPTLPGEVQYSQPAPTQPLLGHDFSDMEVLTAPSSLKPTDQNSEDFLRAAAAKHLQMQRARLSISSSTLPSPSASPPPITTASAMAPLPPKEASGPVRKRQVYASPDPMFQTSVKPPFWNVNCNVLNVDTSIKFGNVISPTVMAGLPFGSLTEMIVPLACEDDDQREMEDR